MRTTLASLLLGFMLCSCAVHTIHPGAPNIQASDAYDTLLVAKAAIDQAKTDLAGGGFPVQSKPLLNDVIRSYNLARSALQTYSDAVTKNQPSDVYLLQLKNDVTDLVLRVKVLAGGQQ